MGKIYVLRKSQCERHRCKLLGDALEATPKSSSHANSRASACAGALPQPPLLAMAVLMAVAVARLVDGVVSCCFRSWGLGAGAAGEGETLWVTTGEAAGLGLGVVGTTTGLGLGLGVGEAAGEAPGRHCAAALALAEARALLMAWPLPLA
jgi:hypothetical protein